MPDSIRKDGFVVFTATIVITRSGSDVAIQFLKDRVGEVCRKILPLYVLS